MGDLTPTKRQVELLEFVERFRSSRGYSPTIREIAKAFGLSSAGTVAEHLDSLEDRGLIRRQPDRARSVLLTRGGRSLLSERERSGASVIPLLGTVAAGEPIEALAVPDRIEVPSSMTGTRRCYALRVRGDSMVDEGIFDGDYVIVEENPAPENGETVVALIEGTEATLKRLYRERDDGGERIRLQPANPEMEPILLEAGKRVEVQGRVRGVLRLL